MQRQDLWLQISELNRKEIMEKHSIKSASLAFSFFIIGHIISGIFNFAQFLYGGDPTNIGTICSIVLIIFWLVFTVLLRNHASWLYFSLVYTTIPLLGAIADFLGITSFIIYIIVFGFCPPYYGLTGLFSPYLTPLALLTALQTLCTICILCLRKKHKIK